MCLTLKVQYRVHWSSRERLHLLRWTGNYIPYNLPAHYDVFLNLIASVLKKGAKILRNPVIHRCTTTEQQNAHGLQNLKGYN
jgi:hypothetical protein